MKPSFLNKSKLILSGNTILITIIFSLLFSCQPQDEQSSKNKDEVYYQSIENWKQKRIAYLKSHDGWLNLAGLFWLEEGENTVGSHAENTIIFPSDSPELLGSFFLYDEKVIFNSNPTLEVLHDGIPVDKIELKPDITMDPTILTYDSLAWFIIKREDQFGVRLRNYNQPEIEEFGSIPCYKTKLNWKVEAKLKPTSLSAHIAIPNVMGQVSYEEVPGILEFNLEGKSYQLYPLGTSENLWLVFADETSGTETYGGGRFLEVDGPDKKGNYVIDFNKAYNPPCAFTPFATCPLPPKENILRIPITAGEKNVPHKWH